jgi:hypothetical protein
MLPPTTLTVVLLSLSTLDFTSAAPSLSIGRHAPPYLAGKLGGHKRAIEAWFKKTGKGKKTLTKDAEEVDYYGASHGLVSARYTFDATVG